MANASRCARFATARASGVRVGRHIRDGIIGLAGGDGAGRDLAGCAAVSGTGLESNLFGLCGFLGDFLFASASALFAGRSRGVIVRINVGLRRQERKLG